MKIELTDSEIEVVMKALHHFAMAPHSVRKGVCIAEINEIADDIREQECRRDDEWGDPADFTSKHDPLINHTFSIAEQDFIQQGIDAREQRKASSKAADRRASRMMKGTATSTVGDTWPLNDPADW